MLKRFVLAINIPKSCAPGSSKLGLGGKREGEALPDISILVYFAFLVVKV